MYYKSNVTKKWLYDNGFRYDRVRSDFEEEIYSRRFPVMKYKTITVLEGEISIVESTGHVQIDVYKDCGTHLIYHPFYYEEFGNSSVMLEKINNSIEQEIKRLKITKKKEKKDGKKNR